MDDIQTLRQVLADSRVIAVVGLSANWWRPSYFAAKYLQDHGYRIIPVNPGYESILGERCYARLEDIPESIDVVDLFQRPEKVEPHVDAAIRLGVPVLWMQIGVINDAVAEKARKAGMTVIMDRCMKIEHARLFGGLNLVGVNTGVVSSRRPKHIST